MPWPGHYNPTSEGPQSLRLSPFIDTSESVGATNEVELGARVLRREVRQRVNGVRHSPTDHVYVRNLQLVVVRGGETAHLKSLPSRRSGRLALEGLSSRRHEENGVKTESRAHLTGHNEVANVDGIERAPQDADSCVSHPGGECQRS